MDDAVQLNDRLTREQLAAALTRVGLPIKPSTLAAMALRGDGPPFAVWGRRPLYSLDAALAWAQRRLDESSRSHVATDESRLQRATA
jgi:hypothetical protein